MDEKHHVAKGYDADVLIRWGDPIFPDSPPFDPLKQTAETQKRQFGMNNDFLGFIPLQADGNRGLLCVHHEYAEPQMMFPGLGTNVRAAMLATTADHVEWKWPRWAARLSRSPAPTANGRSTAHPNTTAASP